MNIAIKGYENYTVDEHGIVKNINTGHMKIAVSNHTGKGYWYVDLYNKGERTRKYIHRLVAEAFINKIDDKPYVNHIDGDSENNEVSNLEWCSPLENVEHASKVIKTMKQYYLANMKRRKAVKQLELHNRRLVDVFESISEASKKTGIPTSNIVNVLKGKQSRTKNFIWCYVEELI